MERAFSVDDILGTFWKLDTHGEGTNEGGNSVAGALEDDQAGGSNITSDASMVKRMSRSASEWAFQEFLKLYTASLSGGHTVKDPKEDGDCLLQDLGQPHTFSTYLAMDGQPKPRLNPLETVQELDSNPENSSHSGSREKDSAPQELGSALNPLFAGLSTEASSSICAKNSHEYESFLKQKLDMACAAVALTRATGLGASKDLPKDENSFALDAVRMSEIRSSENYASTSNPVGIPPLPLKPVVKSERRISRTTTSGSSHDPSDTEENDLDLGANGLDVDPNNLKREKRMLSNRESARRSRRRKQAHLSDLEMQVAQLRIENSELLKQVAEITRKFNEAAIDNRILKSDVEALRVKVRMAEDLALRNSPAAAPAMSSRNTSEACKDSHESTDFEYNYANDLLQVTGVPFPYSKHQSPAYASHIPLVNTFSQKIAEVHYTQGSKMGRTPSMRRIASLEHLKKRICGGASCNPASWGQALDIEIPPISKDSIIE